MTTLSAHAIALVEDDRILREELALFLRREGYKVHEAGNASGLDEVLLRHTVQAIVLDIGLPGTSGLELARQLRVRRADVGIIMVTARTGLPDRVGSYEAGADIYIPKPASPEELLAALRSVLRRSGAETRSQSWVIDPVSGALHPPGGGPQLLLTPSEAKLLHALAQACGQCVSSDDLCALLGGDERERPITRRALENIVSRLRHKLTAQDASLAHGGIRADWRQGYRFAMPLCVRLLNAQA